MLSKLLRNDSRPLYLMVSAYFPRPDNTWTCSFVYDLCKAIEDTGKYQVIVINPRYSGDYLFRGIKVVGFQERISGRWLAPQLVDARNISEMFKTINRAGIDLRLVAVAHGQIVTSAPYLKALKKANKGIKTILHFQDPDPYGMLFGVGRLGFLKKIIYFRYYRGLAEGMDLLVGISNNVTKVIKEAPRQTVYNSYKPMRSAMHALRFCRTARVKRVYTLHNCVKKGIFSKEGHKGVDQEFVIGCVAVFRDWKDQISLLKAVSLLKDRIKGLKVKLVGVDHSGSMYQDCLEYVKKNGLPVTICDSIDHKELQEFYRSLDLFVLPSYFEGFGCVFTEAWSCGTPFITCKGQAMDDLISYEDMDLWLCNERDPSDLARKIEKYYLCRCPQKLVAETDIDITVPQFIEFVESI